MAHRRARRPFDLTIWRISAVLYVIASTFRSSSRMLPGAHRRASGWLCRRSGPARTERRGFPPAHDVRQSIAAKRLQIERPYKKYGRLHPRSCPIRAVVAATAAVGSRWQGRFRRPQVAPARRPPTVTVLRPLDRSAHGRIPSRRLERGRQLISEARQRGMKKSPPLWRAPSRWPKWLRQPYQAISRRLPSTKHRRPPRSRVNVAGSGTVAIAVVTLSKL